MWNCRTEPKLGIVSALAEEPATGFARPASGKPEPARRHSLSPRERARVRGNATQQSTPPSYPAQILVALVRAPGKQNPQEHGRPMREVSENADDCAKAERPSPSPQPSPSGRARIVSALIETLATGFAKLPSEKSSHARNHSLSPRERARVRGNATQQFTTPSYPAQILVALVRTPSRQNTDEHGRPMREVSENADDRAKAERPSASPLPSPSGRARIVSALAEEPANGFAKLPSKKPEPVRNHSLSPRERARVRGNAVH